MKWSHIYIYTEYIYIYILTYVFFSDATECGGERRAKVGVIGMLRMLRMNTSSLCLWTIFSPIEDDANNNRRQKEQAQQSHRPETEHNVTIRLTIVHPPTAAQPYNHLCLVYDDGLVVELALADWLSSSALILSMSIDRPIYVLLKIQNWALPDGFYVHWEFEDSSTSSTASHPTASR